MAPAADFSFKIYQTLVFLGGFRGFILENKSVIMATFLNILALIFPLIVGLPLALAWSRGRSWVETISLSWFLGIAVMATVLIPIGLSGIPYRPAILNGGLVVALILLCYSIFRIWRARLPLTEVQRDNSTNHISRWAFVFLFLTAVNVYVGAKVAFNTPISVWDVVQFWLPKAEALRPPGTLRALALTVYPDYPPLWPLQIGLTRSIAADPSVVKLLPAFYLIVFLGLVYAYLSKHANACTAAVALWLISGLPYLHFFYGLMDLLAEVPLMAFVGAASVLLARFYFTHERRDAWASLVLASTAILIRPEGFQVAFIIAFVLGARAWRNRQWIVASMCVVIPVSVFIGWLLTVRFCFRHAATYQVNLSLLTGNIVISALTHILRYECHELLNPFIFGPTLLEIIVILVAWRSWRIWGPFAAIFFGSMAVISMTYIILPTINGMPLKWWLETGFKRMLLHFVPLLVIAAALGSHAVFRRGLVESSSAPCDRSAGRRNAGWRDAAAYLLLSITLIAAAGYYSGLFRPTYIHLSRVIPNGELYLYSPVSYGYEKGWWQAQNPGNVDAIMTEPKSGITGGVLYDLTNLGYRGSNDGIYDHFVSFRAKVGIVGTTAGSVRFLVIADGHQIAAIPRVLTGKDGFIPIATSLPISTHWLELAVDSVGDNNSDAAVWIEPRLKRGGSGLLVAGVLLLGAGSAAASALAFGRKRWSRVTSRLIGLRPILIVLFVAVLIMQADAIANCLLRVGRF